MTPRAALGAHAGFLVTAVVVLAACRGPQEVRATSRGAPSQPFPRPNLLLITIDALRADHLGTYGYRRRTSPRIDAFARSAAVFEQAYTYWPKTRGSFAMMLTGRTAARNGYSARHPGIPDFNPTLASVVQAAGYRTVAAVDNPNVARLHGYAKGFDSYRETWEEPGLASEIERTNAITDTGTRALASRTADRPLFLWLHYVNPHAPYTPPPPYDTAFRDEKAAAGRRLRAVDGFHGGIRKEWAVQGRDRLGYYISQYDGEIAAADAEVGRVLDALRKSPAADRTVVVIASDHGESLGEHDYYFDHGEDLFDPCLRIPLVVSVPGGRRGLRVPALATTLDIVPTILDAAKVSYPPELSGKSLLPALLGGSPPASSRLFAQNDRGLVGAFDARFKLVATPSAQGPRLAFYDRSEDPAEMRLAGARRANELRESRRDMELFTERTERESAATQRLAERAPSSEGAMSREGCEKLKALGYVAGGFDCAQ